MLDASVTSVNISFLKEVAGWRSDDGDGNAAGHSSNLWSVWTGTLLASSRRLLTRLGDFSNVSIIVTSVAFIPFARKDLIYPLIVLTHLR